MRKLITILMVLALAGTTAFAQESRREQRKIRQKENAEEIRKLVEKGDLRFLANFAYPMYGGSIHLTSEYTLDLEGNFVSAFLPFYGRAYYAEYGGRNGGIRFSEEATSLEWKTGRKGHSANIEVKVKNDVYKIYLNISPSGYGTLDVSSINRQTIRFSGIVTKRKADS